MIKEIPEDIPDNFVDTLKFLEKFPPDELSEELKDIKKYLLRQKEVCDKSDERRSDFNLKFGKRKTMYFDMDGNPLSMWEWSSYIEDKKFNRHIGDDVINGYRVSTVWMGIDHSFSLDRDHPPIIFETMIFPSDYYLAPEDVHLFDHYQERYSTKEQAAEGHKKACDFVREETA